ncbi:hypothetical protein GCM10020255_041830 [Rhodococcus baikonurensis]
MDVVSTCVHHAIRLGGVGQTGVFCYRQRVHVGAQQDHRTATPREYSDDTRTADPDSDVPAADSPKFLGNDCSSASFVTGQLWVCMQVLVQIEPVRLNGSQPRRVSEFKVRKQLVHGRSSFDGGVQLAIFS